MMVLAIVIVGYIVTALLAGRMSFIFYDSFYDEVSDKLSPDEESKIAISMLFGPVAFVGWLLVFLVNWGMNLVTKDTKHKKALRREQAAIEAAKQSEAEKIELNKIIKEAGLDKVANL